MFEYIQIYIYLLYIYKYDLYDTYTHIIYTQSIPVMSMILHTLCQLSSLLHLILLNLDPSSLVLPGLGIIYHHCNINFITMNNTHVSTRYLYLNVQNQIPGAQESEYASTPKKNPSESFPHSIMKSSSSNHETSRQIGYDDS